MACSENGQERDRFPGSYMPHKRNGPSTLIPGSQSPRRCTKIQKNEGENRKMIKEGEVGKGKDTQKYLSQRRQRSGSGRGVEIAGKRRGNTLKVTTPAQSK